MINMYPGALGIMVGDPGEPVLIVTLVILAIVMVGVAALAVRRRGRKNRGRWWQGPGAPKDEPFFYQRRDDSGQGGS